MNSSPNFRNKLFPPFQISLSHSFRSASLSDSPGLWLVCDKNTGIRGRKTHFKSNKAFYELQNTKISF